MQSENNNYPLKENDYVKLDDNQKKILEIIGNYYNCQTIKNTVMYKFRETTEGNLYEFLNSNFYNDKKISNSESINRIIEILIEFYNNNWRDWFQNSYNEHIIDIKDIIKEMFIEKYLLKINDNKFKENDLSDLISKFFYPYFTKNLNKIKYSEIDFIFYSKIKDIYPAVIDAITPQSKPDAIDVNPARTAGIISNEEPAADSKTASEPIKEKISNL
ncbi:MAG TPA: hypothetical protein PLQ81_02060 [bacterium]|nr:hypothetical protein [bacterium]